MKILVVGCLGKVGREISKMLLQDINDFQVIGCVSKDSKYDGLDLGECIGLGQNGNIITSDLEYAISQADVVIDFTNADTFKKIIELSHKYSCKIVSGTTGVDDKFLEYIINDYSKDRAILWSPNMSIAVNLMRHFISSAKDKLGDDYDIGLFDVHNKHKKDSPSGTSKMFGKDLDLDLNNDIVSLRLGGVVADTKVIFANDVEVFEMTHKAINRNVFAAGAIKAMKFLKDKEKGFYSMKEVLGL